MVEDLEAIINGLQEDRLQKVRREEQKRIRQEPPALYLGSDPDTGRLLGLRNGAVSAYASHSNSQPLPGQIGRGFAGGFDRGNTSKSNLFIPRSNDKFPFLGLSYLFDTDLGLLWGNNSRKNLQYEPRFLSRLGPKENWILDGSTNTQWFAISSSSIEVVARPSIVSANWYGPKFWSGIRWIDPRSDWPLFIQSFAYRPGNNPIAIGSWVNTDFLPDYFGNVSDSEGHSSGPRSAVLVGPPETYIELTQTASDRPDLVRFQKPGAISAGPPVPNASGSYLGYTQVRYAAPRQGFAGLAGIDEAPESEATISAERSLETKETTRHLSANYAASGVENSHFVGGNPFAYMPTPGTWTYSRILLDEIITTESTPLQTISYTSTQTTSLTNPWQWLCNGFSSHLLTERKETYNDNEQLIINNNIKVGPDIERPLYYQKSVTFTKNPVDNFRRSEKRIGELFVITESINSSYAEPHTYSFPQPVVAGKITVWQESQVDSNYTITEAGTIVNITESPSLQEDVSGSTEKETINYKRFLPIKWFLKDENNAPIELDNTFRFLKGINNSFAAPRVPITSISVPVNIVVYDRTIVGVNETITKTYFPGQSSTPSVNDTSVPYRHTKTRTVNAGSTSYIEEITLTVLETIPSFYPDGLINLPIIYAVKTTKGAIQHHGTITGFSETVTEPLRSDSAFYGSLDDAIPRFGFPSMKTIVRAISLLHLNITKSVEVAADSWLPFFSVPPTEAELDNSSRSIIYSNTGSAAEVPWSQPRVTIAKQGDIIYLYQTVLKDGSDLANSTVDGYTETWTVDVVTGKTIKGATIKQGKISPAKNAGRIDYGLKYYPVQ
jgi:hypothetical protein